MASYRIVFKQSVAKDLRQIPKKDVQRIMRRIEALAEDPRPSGVEKISRDEKYRIRQGNYRLLYSIDDDNNTVMVVKAGHHRGIYR